MRAPSTLPHKHLQGGWRLAWRLLHLPNYWWWSIGVHVFLAQCSKDATSLQLSPYEYRRLYTLPMCGLYCCWYWSTYWWNSCVHLCGSDRCRRLHYKTFGELPDVIPNVDMSLCDMCRAEQKEAWLS